MKINIVATLTSSTRGFSAFPFTFTINIPGAKTTSTRTGHPRSHRAYMYSHAIWRRKSAKEKPRLTICNHFPMRQKFCQPEAFVNHKTMWHCTGPKRHSNMTLNPTCPFLGSPPAPIYPLSLAAGTLTLCFITYIIYILYNCGVCVSVIYIPYKYGIRVNPRALVTAYARLYIREVTQKQLKQRSFVLCTRRLHPSRGSFGIIRVASCGICTRVPVIRGSLPTHFLSGVHIFLLYLCARDETKLSVW